MLHYAVIFLVIALIAGVLGFSGIAGTASQRRSRASIAGLEKNATIQLPKWGSEQEGCPR